jgi:hypothetical protein
MAAPSRNIQSAEREKKEHSRCFKQSAALAGRDARSAPACDTSAWLQSLFAIAKRIDEPVGDWA